MSHPSAMRSAGARIRPPLEKLLAFLFLTYARDHTKFLNSTWSEVLEDVDKAHRHQALGALKDDRHRARRLVIGVVAADLVEHGDDIGAAANLAAPRAGRRGRPGRRPRLARRCFAARIAGALRHLR